MIEGGSFGDGARVGEKFGEGQGTGPNGFEAVEDGGEEGVVRFHLAGAAAVAEGFGAGWVLADAIEGGGDPEFE